RQGQQSPHAHTDALAQELTTFDDRDETSGLAPKAPLANPVANSSWSRLHVRARYSYRSVRIAHAVSFSRVRLPLSRGADARIASLHESPCARLWAKSRSPMFELICGDYSRAGPH